LVAKVEFELQFTGLYSPADDPADGDTVVAAFIVVEASVAWFAFIEAIEVLIRMATTPSERDRIDMVIERK
jgi:hypothetical protein